MAHEFAASLQKSHAAQDLPFWETVYHKAFPTMIGMHNHRKDGQYQRSGVDRSIVLEHGKVVYVDEKTRWRNEKTGRVYEDIALEYLSSDRTDAPGWVCKPLIADYIAYAIAPLGWCYLLPVIQLQQVWSIHGPKWLEEMRQGKRDHIVSDNVTYKTHSVSVFPKELFPLIGGCLRQSFDPVEKCDVS